MSVSSVGGADVSALMSSMGAQHKQMAVKQASGSQEAQGVDSAPVKKQAHQGAAMAAQVREAQAAKMGRIDTYA